MRRALYLVIFAVLVAALASGALYHHRHRMAAPVPSKTAAGCDTPAPPPPPPKETPKLPDFLEAGCGPGAPAAKKAPVTK